MNHHFYRKMRAAHFLLGGALTALAAMPAAAQTAPADGAGEGEEIVVSGYRRSLEEAIDMKRNTIGFSDSIVATDIADFPEQNLSEALHRIPGVSIERDKGLGTRVNVRGLPTEFTFVSINKLATASGSGGRDVEFDIFALELIQSVTMQKSPTAADEEGGITGSVAKQQRTNRTDSNSGINFRPISRWTDRAGANRNQAIAVLQRDAGITFIDAMKNQIVFLDKVGDRVYQNDQHRLGLSGSLQYKPSDTFSLAFDAFVGLYDMREDEYDAAGYSASSNSTLETIHDFDATTLADSGIVVLRDVSYTNTQHEFMSKQYLNETDYRQFGGEMNWETGNWKINALGGYSGAKKILDFANLKHVAYAPSRTRYTENGGAAGLSVRSL